MITAMEVVSALVVGESERSAENPTHRTGEGAHPVDDTAALLTPRPSYPSSQLRD
jgi:hypothetical protein